MDVIVAETDRAIAEGQKALRRAKKNLEAVDRKILKVKISDEQLATRKRSAIANLSQSKFV